MENKNQDWIGNGKSVFSSLGAKTCALSKREPTDFYATDPHALEVFLKTLKQDGIVLPHKICDKTTPRLIQFHTLKNAVNPPFLGGFLISGTVAA